MDYQICNCWMSIVIVFKPFLKMAFISTSTWQINILPVVSGRWVDPASLITENCWNQPSILVSSMLPAWSGFPKRKGVYLYLFLLLLLWALAIVWILMINYLSMIYTLCFCSSIHFYLLLLSVLVTSFQTDCGIYDYIFGISNRNCWVTCSSHGQ